MGELDHLVISAEALAEGAAAVERLLGVPLEPGGRHDRMGTHNWLLSLGGATYLEVIARDPSADPPDRPRWFDLDNFSGATRLTNWALRSEDINESLFLSPAGSGVAEAMSRGEYRWQVAIPPDGRQPFDGLFPLLLSWQGAHPAAALPDRGCRLRRLTLGHPEAGRLAATLRRLTSDPRIAMEQAPTPELRAEIDTPAGPAVLE